MSFFKKIKEKFLNLSNSYVFYKNEYFLLLTKNKEQNTHIKLLVDEVSQKNNEINDLNDCLLNQEKYYEDMINRFNYVENYFNILNDKLVNLTNINDKLSLMSNEINSILHDLNNLNSTNNDYYKNLMYNLSTLDNLLNVVNDLIVDNNLEFSKKYDLGVSRIIDFVIKDNNNNIKNQLGDVNDNLLSNFKNVDSYLSKFDNENVIAEIRKYFFNGQESVLKQFMDTDFLFNVCYSNNIKFISFSPEENRILLKTDDGILFSTNNHVWTMMEVYGLNEYIIPQLYHFDDFVVFDVGMNRAYASLKFANFENCSAVYGFEIDEFTFNCALENISFNPFLSHKIIPFNFGLSNVDGLVDLYCLEGIDGLNTIVDEFIDVQPSLRNNKDKLYTKQVEVKNATNVISSIIERNNIHSNLVLKIDTEGAEYKIIGDLIKSGLINKFDVILGEGHMFSDEDFRANLENLGFKIIKMNIEAYTYSFAFVKETYFKFWPKY